MFKHMKIAGSNIYGLEARGVISKEDYLKDIFPVFDKAQIDGKKLRFLFYLGNKYEGFSIGAALQDLKFGLFYINALEKIAVVTDVKWIFPGVKFFSKFVSCPVELFHNEELKAAKLWLKED